MIGVTGRCQVGTRDIEGTLWLSNPTLDTKNPYKILTGKKILLRKKEMGAMERMGLWAQDGIADCERQCGGT